MVVVVVMVVVMVLLVVTVAMVVVVVVMVVMVVLVVMEVEATICLTMSLHNVQGEDARQMGFAQLPWVEPINLSTAWLACS